jgi:hypothetical protein
MSSNSDIRQPECGEKRITQSDILQKALDRFVTARCDLDWGVELLEKLVDIKIDIKPYKEMALDLEDHCEESFTLLHGDGYYLDND